MLAFAQGRGAELLESFWTVVSGGLFVVFSSSFLLRPKWFLFAFSIKSGFH